MLKKICWYAVLAAADSEQVTQLHTTALDKKLEQLPGYKELLQTFITKEVGAPACCQAVGVLELFTELAMTRSCCTVVCRQRAGGARHCQPPHALGRTPEGC